MYYAEKSIERLNFLVVQTWKLGIVNHTDSKSVDMYNTSILKEFLIPYINTKEVLPVLDLLYSRLYPNCKIVCSNYENNISMLIKDKVSLYTLYLDDSRQLAPVYYLVTIVRVQKHLLYNPITDKRYVIPPASDSILWDVPRYFTMYKTYSGVRASNIEYLAKMYTANISIHIEFSYEVEYDVDRVVKNYLKGFMPYFVKSFYQTLFNSSVTFNSAKWQEENPTYKGITLNFKKEDIESYMEKEIETLRIDLNQNFIDSTIYGGDTLSLFPSSIFTESVCVFNMMRFLNDVQNYHIKLHSEVKHSYVKQEIKICSLEDLLHEINVKKIHHILNKVIFIHI